MTDEPHYYTVLAKFKRNHDLTEIASEVDKRTADKIVSLINPRPGRAVQIEVIKDRETTCEVTIKHYAGEKIVVRSQDGLLVSF